MLFKTLNSFSILCCLAFVWKLTPLERQHSRYQIGIFAVMFALMTGFWCLLAHSATATATTGRYR